MTHLKHPKDIQTGVMRAAKHANWFIDERIQTAELYGCPMHMCVAGCPSPQRTGLHACAVVHGTWAILFIFYFTTGGETIIIISYVVPVSEGSVITGCSGCYLNFKADVCFKVP